MYAQGPTPQPPFPTPPPPRPDPPSPPVPDRPRPISDATRRTRLALSSVNRPYLVPARLAQDRYVILVYDVPSIGPEMRQQLVRFSRNLGDVDGPSGVDRFE